MGIKRHKPEEIVTKLRQGGCSLVKGCLGLMRPGKSRTSPRRPYLISCRQNATSLLPSRSRKYPSQKSPVPRGPGAPSSVPPISIALACTACTVSGSPASRDSIVPLPAVAGALSEERGRARKFDPPVVSSGNLTPFGKGERAIEFEDLAAAKMAFLVKMVVDRSVDRNELLERFHTPEFRHRTLSLAKRLV